MVKFLTQAKKVFIFAIIFTVFFISYRNSIALAQSSIADNSDKETSASLIYESMKKNSEKSEFYSALDDTVENSTKQSFDGWLYPFYLGVCSYAPYILVFSVVSGSILFLLARRNKGIRRFAAVTLCICIPAITLFLVFGLGAILGMFAH